MLTFFLATIAESIFKKKKKKKTKKNKKKRTRRGNICMTINNKNEYFSSAAKKRVGESQNLGENLCKAKFRNPVKNNNKMRGSAWAKSSWNSEPALAAKFYTPSAFEPVAHKDNRGL